eukprot:COSAG04_NODE_231_length_19199_cov_263.690209_6_plen_90_part_00
MGVFADFANERFDVDLLFGNNVWEPVDREVQGELRTVAWEDVAHFFSIGAEPQPKRLHRSFSRSPPVRQSRRRPQSKVSSAGWCTHVLL